MTQTPPPSDPAAFPQADAIGILYADQVGSIVDCCIGAVRLFGGAREQLLKRSLADVFPQDAGVAGDFGAGRAVVQCEATALDGRSFPALVTRVRAGAPAEPAGFVVTDLTHLHRQLGHLRRLSAAIEQAGDAVAVTNERGIIEYVNAAFEKVTGYRSPEALGRPMSLLRSDRHPPAFYQALWRTLRSGAVFRGRFTNCRKDGSLFHEQKTISPIRDPDGRITAFVSTGQDVTREVEIEQRLDQLANYDLLTGLPNRSLFMDRLRHAVATAQRSGRLLALLHLDLDRFKLINDTLGLAAGDELLRITAQRLRACLREVDTVCRMGGDEFSIILADLDSTLDTLRVVKAILATFAEPVTLEGKEIFVSASVGISTLPGDGHDAATLLRRADLAMSHARAAGRNGFAFFQPGMDESVRESLVLESELRGALERGEFSLDYQPQMDMARGAIVGVEALLRWHHPQRGLVPPVRFIPLLEQMGLMGLTSEWVIATACGEMQRLMRETGLELQVAVNLSSGQFKDPHLIDHVHAVLGRTGLDPQRLEVEITEGTLMENVPATVSTLEALARSGVRIAVDDFGTGYSSLAYLRRFAIDTIKIDRSFISDTPRDADATAIVKAIISLGRDLEMNVVAEGIETPGQYVFLQSLGCTRAQGYLFSRPLSAPALGQFMQTWREFKAGSRPGSG